MDNWRGKREKRKKNRRTKKITSREKNDGHNVEPWGKIKGRRRGEGKKWYTKWKKGDLGKKEGKFWRTVGKYNVQGKTTSRY